METSRALELLTTLANGRHPFTGEAFPADSPYQHPDLIRSLFFAVRALESTRNPPMRSTGETARSVGETTRSVGEKARSAPGSTDPVHNMARAERKDSTPALPPHAPSSREESSAVAQAGQSGETSKAGQSGETSKAGQSGEDNKAGQSGGINKAGQSGDSTQAGQSGDSTKPARSGNSGKAWSVIEDQALLTGYDAGQTIQALARTHQRSRLAIEARLARYQRVPMPSGLRSASRSGPDAVAGAPNGELQPTSAAVVTVIPTTIGPEVPAPEVPALAGSVPGSLHNDPGTAPEAREPAPAPLFPTTSAASRAVAAFATFVPRANTVDPRALPPVPPLSVPLRH